MKREVAELSGNFRGELSSQDGGEGNRSVFSLCKELWNTRRRVISKQVLEHVEKQT